MGRPSKLTEHFKEVASKIVNDNINAVILTDEELLFLINEELNENEQVANRTFQDWKANSKDSEFLRIVKKARITQKRNILDKLEKAPNNWQKYAWILERKFTEFNLKQLSEVKHDIPDITINIKLDES